MIFKQHLLLYSILLNFTSRTLLFEAVPARGCGVMKKGGAYVLYLDVKRSITLCVGSLKRVVLPSGRYAYVGSAHRSIAGRVSRHKRLAEQKTGKLHWHIDYLLTHPQIQLAGAIALAGISECDLSRRIASRRGSSTPVANFGSTDCRAGCKAHLYRLGTAQSAPSALRRSVKNKLQATRDIPLLN
jgi:Uri superfamily endonuclease